jgi:tRNA/tmRNA/rRNA uracil-C5-methylase (TrmA/RlmC/RlmD family)
MSPSQENDEIITNSKPKFDFPKGFKHLGPFGYREEAILKVESLTNLGLGVCRKRYTVPKKKDNDLLSSPAAAAAAAAVQVEEDADDSTEEERDWVVFVPNVIPGEIVKVSVYRNHKSYSDADLLSVIGCVDDDDDNFHNEQDEESIIAAAHPHPHRVTPICPVFDQCGGCQYQHMSLEAQRVWKKEQVVQAFERIGSFKHLQSEDDERSNSLRKKTPTINNEDGGISIFTTATTPAAAAALSFTVQDTLGTSAEHAYKYRSKLTPHYQAPDKQTQIIKAIGFKHKITRSIIDTSHCAIATDAINEKYGEVRENVLEGAKKGTLKKMKKGATLLFRDCNEGVITDHQTLVSTNIDLGPRCSSSSTLSSSSSSEDGEGNNENENKEEQQQELIFKFKAGNFFRKCWGLLSLRIIYLLLSSCLP